MRKTLLTQMLLLIICSFASANTYYVAVNGSDSNAGTIGSPWGTWQKAFETALPGDTVYFRGGVWHPVAPSVGNAITYINPSEGVGHNGAPGNPIHYLNYPGEIPILDCELVIAPVSQFSTNRYLVGITMYDVHWIHFRGLTVRNVYQREANVSARGVIGYPVSNMIFERVTVHNTGAEGWYMHSSINVIPPADYGDKKFGWDDANIGLIPYDTIKYINCDTYQCCDTFPSNDGNTPGNMSDGFKHITSKGQYITYSGCRAWHCGDDGFDIPGPAKKIIENCWSFNHLYPSYNFEGNGFKIGGNSVLNPVEFVTATFRNNLSAWNSLGFYDLEYPDYRRNNSRVYNNTIYKCKVGISISDNANYPGSLSRYYNNIVYKPTSVDAAGRPYVLDLNDFYTENHNTWDYAESGSLPNWTTTDTVTVTDDDFVMIDDILGLSQLMAPRKADGSLPDITFLQLAPTSDLIDAGINVGLPYTGNAPDIGAFESGKSSGLSKIATNNLRFTISPTLVEEEALFQFTGKHSGVFHFEIYNLSGIKVLETESTQIVPGTNSKQVNLTTFKHGLYLCRLICNKQITSTLKFVKK